MPTNTRSPRLQAELERIAGERFKAQREIERFYRGEFLRVALQCIGSSFAGVWLILLSFHMTDPMLAQIPFWGGMLLGYAGISLSLISAYNRGTERGDW